MSDVVYLYGFVPHDAPAPPADMAGVGGMPVTLLDIGPVRAAVSQLPASSFSPAALEPRLADLVWVGERGLEHEGIVAWFVDHTDIAPARLFSLHSSAAALHTAVASRAPAIAERLRTFAGRREWNLKVAYDPDRLAAQGAAVSDELRDIDAQIAAAAPGRRYLLQRKRADSARHELRRAARRLAGELFDTLAVHASDTRTLPLSGEPDAGNVVLSAALLVDRSTDAALQHDALTQIATLEALGLLVTFSGPWAPYRFVESDVPA